jgi:hypothetical protein
MADDPPQIRLTLDDTIADGHYVNFANVTHSPTEFVIDMGRLVPGRSEAKIFSRVIATPVHAKQFLEALTQNIAVYEQTYGKIVDPAYKP